MTAIIVLWIRHQTLIKNIGDYKPFEREGRAGQ
jgi:hypothetical protein